MYCYVLYRVQGYERVVGFLSSAGRRSWCHVFNLTLFKRIWFFLHTKLVCQSIFFSIAVFSFLFEITRMVFLNEKEIFVWWRIFCVFVNICINETHKKKHLFQVSETKIRRLCFSCYKREWKWDLRRCFLRLYINQH